MQVQSGPMFDIAYSEAGLILPSTPLQDLPGLARATGVGRVLLKREDFRPLGNFKVLGGLYAGLRLLAKPRDEAVPSVLICASDGNHGLAVAAAAAMAKAEAVIYLHEGVGAARAARIRAMGARIERVRGTYDDAVDAAARAATRGEGILAPDTSPDPADRAVDHVMRGYGVLARELEAQTSAGGVQPTHAFLQAGVGGLAAAVAGGLSGIAAPPDILVVEPQTAACVGPALESGRIERIAGDLETGAHMLSCGEASAPALAILRAVGARGIGVEEADLEHAVARLSEIDIATTASGAAGLAGLLRVSRSPTLRAVHRLTSDSVILLILTEGAEPGEVAPSSVHP